MRRTPDLTLAAFRPADPTDLEAVRALIAACNAADYDEPNLPARTVQRVWQTPGFHLARDAWVAVDPDGHLFAYAHLIQNRPPSLDPAVYVEPSRRTGSVESLLLARLEARAQEEAAMAGGVDLATRVSDHNSAGWQTLERAGYRRALTFATMQLVMEAPPAEPRWPAGLAARTFRPGQDEQATYATDEEASRDKGYHSPLTFAQWAARLDLNGERFDPGLWFLAWDETELAGVALCYQDAASGIGWIDHLGVRRPWRGRGLGQALLWQAFAAFYARGTRRVRLNVDVENRTQAQRVYERAGMRTIREYHIYAKALRAAGNAGHEG